MTSSFDGLSTMMNNPKVRITTDGRFCWTKWNPRSRQRLKIRLLCVPRSADILSEAALVDQIKTFFHVYAGNCHRFELILLKDLAGVRAQQHWREKSSSLWIVF